MGILDYFSKPKLTMSSMKEAVVECNDRVKASYYVSTSDSKSMDFSFAKGVGFNAALISDLVTLRNRTRYELRQNGLAKGLGRTYANSAVNTGPMLSIDTADKEWAQMVELAFAAWSKQCGYLDGDSLGEMTHLGVRRFFPDGEYLKVSRIDDDSENPVKLKFLMVSVDRLETPQEFAADPNVVQGIRTDSDGRPVEYYISGNDPDIKQEYVAPTYTPVKKSNVIHVFYREDPAQLRGEPWLAQSLPIYHKLRRYDEATIAAAIVASKFAMMLVNKNPDIVTSAAQILPAGVMDINDGMATVLPTGYEAQGFTSTQPESNNSEFRRDQIAAAGMGVGMPANIATGDSSKSSFASARYDGVALEIEGNVAREMIQSRDLNKTFALWLREALAVGVVDRDPPDVYSLSWRWPREERHTDPLKAANAGRAKTEGGLQTVGAYHMENGKDREQAYQDLKDEVARYKADGLLHPSMVEAEPFEDDDDEGNNNATKKKND